MKILIVEDDFISRKLLKEILKSYGQCDIAVDGEEALTAFSMALEENSPYDLICMDIMMPKMDGQEALKRIRMAEQVSGMQGRREVPVVMVTALDDPKSVVNAFFHGTVSGYIVKPIHKDKVLEKLRSIGVL